MVFHEYYSQILESFQEQYDIRMAFVEGQHHAMALFESYHNLKFGDNGKIIYGNFNNTPISIQRSSVLNTDINIRAVTSTKPTDSLMENLQELSRVYRNMSSTQVQTSIVDLILVCIKVYTQKNIFEPLCSRSLQLWYK